jgi:hypothetical protein
MRHKKCESRATRSEGDLHRIGQIPERREWNRRSLGDLDQSAIHVSVE